MCCLHYNLCDFRGSHCTRTTPINHNHKLSSKLNDHLTTLDAKLDSLSRLEDRIKLEEISANSDCATSYPTLEENVHFNFFGCGRMTARDATESVENCEKGEMVIYNTTTIGEFCIPACLFVRDATNAPR